MIGESIIESSGVSRVSSVPLRRDAENADDAGKASQARSHVDSAGSPPRVVRSRGDPVRSKDDPDSARHERRPETAAEAVEIPRPRIKFRSPRELDPGEPPFEAEGQSLPEPAEPIVEPSANAEAEAQAASSPAYDAQGRSLSSADEGLGESIDRLI